MPNPAGAVETWLAEGVGAVLDLPLEDDRPESPLAHPHRSLFLQANHGRPIASALLRTCQVLERGISPVTRFQEAVLQVSAGVPAPLPAVKRAEGAQALAELQELGFTAVSLDLGRIPKQMRDRSGAYLVTWLGPPDAEAPGRLAWTLPEP